jgi:hypothetical protein
MSCIHSLVVNWEDKSLTPKKAGLDADNLGDAENGLYRVILGYGYPDRYIPVILKNDLPYTLKSLDAETKTKGVYGFFKRIRAILVYNCGLRWSR